MNNNSFEYKDRKYSVVPYDSNWQEIFRKEAEMINKIFTGDSIQIEHVGSTSVPGMEGKPCIDLLVVVRDFSIVLDRVAQMEGAGYVYRGEVEGEGSVLFTRIENNAVKTNVHFHSQESKKVSDMLNLRNYLRSNPEEVTEYSQLKRDLFEKYSNDYAMYRKIKDEYMEKLKERASVMAETTE